MNQLTKSIVLGTCFVFAAAQANAGMLSIGSATGSPGDVVTVAIDVSSVGGADYSSIDAALQITPSVGTGDSPTLTSFSPGAIWGPYSGNLTTVEAPSLGPGITSSVIGISGNVVNQTINSDGTVMSLDITIPGTATAGDVFDLDLVEDFSNVTNSTVQPADLITMTPFSDGTLTIIPEPSAALLLAICAFGLGAFRPKD